MDEAAVRERLLEKGVDVDKLAEESTEGRGTSRVEVQNCGIGFGEIENPRTGEYEKAMLLQVSLAVILDDDAVDDLTNQLAAMRGKVVVARAMPKLAPSIKEIH